MKYQELVVICLVIISAVAQSDCEVRFVFEMFRHGARGPWMGLDKDSKDIFGEYWNGSGELSEVGMRQHYLLGHRNRLKYSNFISKSYDPQEIYVVSTDYNRTIMSAYSQLQGLYAAGSGPLLTDSQSKIGVPPVTVPDLAVEQQIL